MEKVQNYTPDQVRRAVDENRGLLLLHVGSPLASSCEVVHQALESLAGTQLGEFLEFAEVELPLQDLELIQKFSLETVPTLLLFKGNAEVERLEQLLQEEELRDFLEIAVSFYSAANSSSEASDNGL